ncbi:Long chain acyl-CoA synthetase 1, partial [Ananas comosus]
RMRKVYTVQVESGRAGKDGRPSVGPVYRSALAKDGFPPPDPRMSTSWDIFSVAAEKYPNNRMLGWREFVKGKPGCYIWKTYKEVYEEVVQVGSALRQMGAAPGSRIGIYGANCPQWIEAMEKCFEISKLSHPQACNGYSLICVPLYDTLGSGAVDYILDQAEIDIAFVQDKKMKELLFSDCASLRRLKVIVSFTSTTMEQEEAASKIGLQIYSWNDFLRIGKENLCEPLPPRPLDICTIMYTSGTSGNPKGVILTHESNAMYVRGVDLYMDLFDDKDINALRDDLMELKPTLFAGVPRVFERVHEGILKALSELWPHRRMIFNALYKHKLSWMRSGYSHKTASPLADFLAFSKIKARLGGRVRLIISGGAPLNTEIEEFLRVTSCAYVTQGYGLTETCGLSSNGVPDEMSLIGTVGVASTYTELRLEEVPEMGYDPLSVPSRGEICVRGKTLFSGYYKNPELTKEVMIDGWFHTGDIGEISPEGVLKIIDRKKNIFKLSHGEYVAAEYLEKVYGYLPIIEDIWVYGDSYRSMLVAVVAPHEDNTMKWAESNGHKGSFYDICALEELKIYILQELKALAEKNKLRGFECIKGVVVDPVPFNVERDLMTPTMKKKRSQMFKHYQSEIEKLYKNLAERRGDNNK